LFDPTLDFSANDGGFLRTVLSFQRYYSVFERSTSPALPGDGYRSAQSGFADGRDLSAQKARQHNGLVHGRR
jgi:hypothetical protein